MSNTKNKKHRWGSLILTLLWGLLSIVLIYVVTVIKPDIGAITKQAKNAPRSFKRTDVLVCYQQNGHPYLANLSYGLRDGMTEIYGVNGEVSTYGIKAGDFVEMTYEVTYPSSEDTSPNSFPTITAVESCQKILFSEAEEKRLSNPDVSSFAIRRTAGAYPIGLYFFPDENWWDDFVVVPVGEKYYLYTTASNEPQIFDEFRTIQKDVNKEKPLKVRVLCNENVKDEAILETLYNGTTGNYSDVYFVGYEAPYPLTVYHNDSELSHLFEMKKYFVSAPSTTEDVFLKITPENRNEISIPAEVQSALDIQWNGEDHVIVYSRAKGMTDGVELSYDVNNCLKVYDNGGKSVQGYWLFYVERNFFEYVSDGQHS